MNLQLDWATHQAAKYACEHWHYSKQVPFGKTVKIGVWENKKYIGCVIFGRGSNMHIGKKWGLTQLSCVELVRIALADHLTHVSKIISIALKFLFKQSPGLKMVISFADQNQNHHGGIYQASNWIYLGFGTSDNRCRPYKKKQEIFHWRAVASELSKKRLPSTVDAAKSIGFLPQEYKPKHLYAFTSDSKLKDILLQNSKPYPKRAGSSAVAVPTNHVGEGGSIPTPAL